MRRKTIIGSKQAPLVKNENNNIHVGLLYGGISSERDVSLMSFKGLNDALLELGYAVTPIDVGHDFMEAMHHIKADVIFNGLYGQYSEDGYIPAILDLLAFKYTHSGVVASALGFNKLNAYKIFKMVDIPVVDYKVISKIDGIKTDPIKRPYVLKPINEGSSVGVQLIFEADDFDFANYDWKYGDMIVEPYVPGKELSVPVLDNKAIGIIELVPLKKRFYDYESKYTDGFTKHVMPAPLDKNVEQYILDLSERAHKAIGCKTLSRVDFRYNPDKGIDGVYILEINTVPGMTPLSIVPEICAYNGITYKDILERLIKDALRS